MKNKGFTLLELLVVISIISVLIVVGVGSYTIITKQSRDAKRIADLNNVRAALEMYRSQNNAYPDAYPTLGAGGYITWPNDPLSSQLYYYAGATSDYSLCAKMELSNASAPSGCNGPDNCGTGKACNRKMTAHE